MSGLFLITVDKLLDFFWFESAITAVAEPADFN